MTFLVTGIGACVCFVSKLVCEFGCGCVWICSGNISFQIVFARFRYRNHIPWGNTESMVTKSLISWYSTVGFSPIWSRNTLHCTHIIHNALLYILENTNQNKVSETDHAVTQKLSQPFLLLQFAFFQSSEGTSVSYSSYDKICNLCLPVYEWVLG